MSEIQSWSVTDASNNSASPDGFPENMAPSGLNNSGRAVMGALRRLYGDWNGSLASGGSANAYTLSPNRTISAYAAGIDFTFAANHTNSGAATLNVSSLGAKDIRDRNGVALVGGEISSGAILYVSYDASNGYFRAADLESASAGTTPDASETVKGIVELATAAEVLAGTSQVLAATPYALANAGKSFGASSVYYKLPGGLILQMGDSTATASTSTVITLPVTCPTRGAFAVANILEANTTARDPLKAVTNGINVTVYNPNAASLPFHWMVIGY